MSNSTEQPEKQYEPFGDDWKKDEKLVSALRELYNRAKIYGAFADTNDLNGQALAKAKAAIEQNKI